MTAPGLFLDLDGTLADSLPLLRKAYHSFLEQHGKRGSEDEFQRINGPPLPQIVQLLKESHGLPENTGDLLACYMELLAVAREQTRPAEGSNHVLESFKSEGWTIAVVTSSFHAPTQQWLRRFDLDRHIDLIVGGDDVSRGKPNPEPYLLALQRTGGLKEYTLAVEDSLQGATAACAAGIPVILLGKALPPNMLELSLLRGFVPRFADIATYASRHYA